MSPVAQTERWPCRKSNPGCQWHENGSPMCKTDQFQLCLMRNSLNTDMTSHGSNPILQQAVQRKFAMMTAGSKAKYQLMMLKFASGDDTPTGLHQSTSNRVLGLYKANLSTENSLYCPASLTWRTGSNLCLHSQKSACTLRCLLAFHITACRRPCWP